MQDKLYDWKYTGPILAVIYICLIYCGPWLPAGLTYYRAVNAEHSQKAEEPAHPAFPFAEGLESPDERAEAQNQIEQCTKSTICRVIDYHAFLIVDRTFDDPVALFTIVLAFSTIGLWLQTWKLAVGADLQARDIKGQLEIARDDFNSTHRPWIAFKTSIDDGGISFDSKGALITLNFICRNTGTTPALGVSVNASAYLYQPFGDLARQKTVCESLSAPIDNPDVTGRSMFPGDVETFPKTFRIRQADLDRAAAASQKIIFTVVGCVDYAFSFGRPEAHRSGFIYHLGKADGKRMKAFVVSEGDVPAANVMIVPAAFAGGFFTT